MKLKKCSSQQKHSQQNKTKHPHLRPVALAIALAVSGALPNIAQANTYTVSNTNDAGFGSLRRAVDDANTNSNTHDTIVFSISAGSTIFLDNELLITDSVTIQGPVAGDAGSIILDAQGDHIDPTKHTRHIKADGFPLNSGEIITLENMSLINGFSEGSTIFSASSFSGGAIKVINANLILNHTLISGNLTQGSRAKGGGIHAVGDVTLTDSMVSNNSTSGSRAIGGGITVFGEITLNQSTVFNNSTTGDRAKGGGIFASDAILNQSTISNNTTSGYEAFGGGLNADFVTLTDSVISNNSTAGEQAHGGGLYGSGAFTINQSLFTNNSTTGYFAEGGGFKLRGTGGGGSSNVTLNQSTVSNNFTTGDKAKGGGGKISSGTAVITQSTISNNSTTGTSAHGGGLSLSAISTGSLIQSTVSNNSASGTQSKGGGIYTNQSSTIITQSTIVGNSTVSGAGGLSVLQPHISQNITLINSILAGNTGPSGNFKDETYINPGIYTPTGLLKATNSLFGDFSSEITDPSSSGNYLSDAPDLGPLQFNGGFTQTHKPNDTSPVFDQGSNTEAAGLTTDQRGSGFPRIHNGTVDIGAVELQNNIIAGDAPLSIGEVLTRRDMARIIIKARHPSGYTPPPATGLIYTDVKIGDINADWIEQLHAEGLTEGCAVDPQLATTRFCPDSVVMREDMAKTVFIGAIGIMNPQPSSNFVDVDSQTVINHIWINAAYENQNITLGCAMGKFCPKEPVTREWVDGDLLGEF